MVPYKIRVSVFESIITLLVVCTAGLYLCNSIFFSATDFFAAKVFAADNSSAKATVSKVQIESSVITIEFKNGMPAIGKAEILSWVRRSARAVSIYYKMMPVKRLLLKIDTVDGDDIGFSTTGYENGNVEIEVPIGRDITLASLSQDWVLTHEMVHLAFPLVWRKDRWLTEGMATYVEPLARSKIGNIPEAEVWEDLIKNCGKGQPRDQSETLPSARRIDRIYWGGATFCLIADIEIRKRTRNRMGLQDALAAICNAGKNIESDTEPVDALAIGDKSVACSVLVPLYERFSKSQSAILPDLDAIFQSLGVSRMGRSVRFNDSASLAETRKAISSK